MKSTIFKDLGNVLRYQLKMQTTIICFLIDASKAWYYGYVQKDIVVSSLATK